MTGFLKKIVFKECFLMIFLEKAENWEVEFKKVQFLHLISSM